MNVLENRPLVRFVAAAHLHPLGIRTGGLDRWIAGVSRVADQIENRGTGCRGACKAQFAAATADVQTVVAREIIGAAINPHTAGPTKIENA